MNFIAPKGRQTANVRARRVSAHPLWWFSGKTIHQRCELMANCWINNSILRLFRTFMHRALTCFERRCQSCWCLLACSRRSEPLSTGTKTSTGSRFPTVTRRKLTMRSFWCWRLARDTMKCSVECSRKIWRGRSMNTPRCFKSCRT